MVFQIALRCGKEENPPSVGEGIKNFAGGNFFVGLWEPEKERF